MPPKKQAAAKTEAPADTGGFEFDKGLEIPAKTNAGGSRISDDAAKLMALPEGMSYLKPVEVSDAIKDPGERAKAFAETARAESNRVTGMIRRVLKNAAEGKEGYAHCANRAFETRTVSDDKLGYGVRIWRKADETVQAG